MARHKSFAIAYAPKWNIEIRARKLPVEVYKHLAPLIGVSITVLYAMRYSPLENIEGCPVQVDYDPLYSTVAKVAKFFKCRPHELLNVKKEIMEPVFQFSKSVPESEIKFGEVAA